MEEMGAQLASLTHRSSNNMLGIGSVCQCMHAAAAATCEAETRVLQPCMLTGARAVHISIS